MRALRAIQAIRSAASRARYRIGDLVRLKSGGRSMTATWVGPVAFAPGTWLICEWRGNDGEMRQEMFAERALESARAV